MANFLVIFGQNFDQSRRRSGIFGSNFLTKVPDLRRFWVSWAKLFAMGACQAKFRNFFERSGILVKMAVLCRVGLLLSVQFFGDPGCA